MDRGLLRSTASGLVHHKESELLNTNSRFKGLRRHFLLVELLVSSSSLVKERFELLRSQ